MISGHFTTPWSMISEATLHTAFWTTGRMNDADATPEHARYLAKRIRQIGVKRVLYGSDAAIPPNFPKAGWATFRKLPLTEDEFRTIANNVAPYLKK